MANKMLYVLGGAAVLGAGYILYKRSKKPDNQNPWRGTGTECEASYDKATPEGQLNILKSIANASPEDRKRALTCSAADIAQAKEYLEGMKALDAMTSDALAHMQSDPRYAQPQTK